MKDLLPQRIETLQNVIAWSRENGGLKTGQRICIHQEIAGCLKQIAAIENDSPYQWMETYKIPKDLEEKVQHILGVITNSNWIKQEPKY